MPKWKDLGSKEGRQEILESAKNLVNKGLKNLDKAMDEAKELVDCALHKNDYVKLAQFEKKECSSLAVYEYLILKDSVKTLSDQEHAMKTVLRYKLTNYERHSEAECSYLKDDAHAFLIKLQTECGHTEL
jgi:hypothetical protein